MNITGYKKPTDEEFKKCYAVLFDLTPRPIVYIKRPPEYMKKVEDARKTFFQVQEKTINIDRLPWENWKFHPTKNNWEISNLGRVKINGVIQRQIDSPNGKIGYLVLEKYTSE